MTLSANQQTALEQPVTRLAYFAELQFLSGTSRFSSLGHNLTWGGYEWLGTGGLISISQAEESEDVTSKPLTFGINGAQPQLLALAVGSTEEYRGRAAKLYMCPLAEGFTLIDTPVLCWTGTMDSIAAGLSSEGEGQITLKCETAAFGLKRRPSLRMNAAQQKKKYPTDTGFDYLNTLIAEPQTWLSVKFQQV